MSLIEIGAQHRVISETTSGAGTTSREISQRGASLITSIWVTSISSGSLTVNIYTLTDTGKSILVDTYGPYTTASSSLVLEETTSPLMQRILVEAVYTGECTYELYVRSQAGGTSSGGSSVQTYDCFVALDEVQLGADSELYLGEDVCLDIEITGAGRMLSVPDNMTTELL